MKVVVLILTWNGQAVLADCLQSLTPQLSSERTLMVVDNGSTDESISYVRRFCPDAAIVENGINLGFSGGVNVGLRTLLRSPAPEFVVLLNQDTIVALDWLERLLQPFSDPAVGAVGCKLLYPDGTIQHAGAYLEYPRLIAQHIGWHEHDRGQYDETHEIEYVTGAALALRISGIEQIGFFDEGYNPGYYEDSDFIWRLRAAGYRTMYTGSAHAVHQESSSTSDQVWRSMVYNRNRLRFMLKTVSSAAFWQDCVPAERAFIAQHGVGDEARALRWAYLHALIVLDDTLQARTALHLEDPLPHADVARTLLAFRRWISTCARARLS